MSSRLRIGLDMDGVLYDFTDAMRRWYADQHGIDPATMPTPHQWNIEDVWPHLEGDGARFHQDCKEATLAGHLSAWGVPLPGVEMFMHYLAIRGYEVHIVTARNFGCGPEINYDLTAGWLKQYGLPYSTITISKDKAAVPTDVFLDDKPSNVQDVIAAGSLGVILTQPWNIDRVDLPRVHSLAEFADVVDSISSIKEHSDA